MIPPRLPLILSGLLLALAAGGCGKAERDVDALDRELIGNTASQADPALTAALGDEIVVDPALAKGATRNPAKRAAVATASSGAAARSDGAGTAACYAALAYGDGWAGKLPAGVPLYADARVDEAAGNDAPGCGTRVVSYASAAPAAAIVAFYLGEAQKAGWAAGHERRGGDEVVAGERGKAAFYVAITPRQGGSSIDIVVSGG